MGDERTYCKLRLCGPEWAVEYSSSLGNEDVVSAKDIGSLIGELLLIARSLYSGTLGGVFEGLTTCSEVWTPEDYQALREAIRAFLEQSAE